MTHYSTYSNIANATTWEAEAIVLIAAMTTPPSDALKLLINTTIAGLKDDGIFDLGDCMYVRGVHDSQAACLNWIKRLHDSTLIAAPTFTAKQGITGDSSGKCINNNYIPSIQAVKFGLTDCSIVVMHHTISTNSGRYVLGAYNSVSPLRCRMLYNTGGNPERMYMNSALYEGTAEMLNDVYIGYTRSGANITPYTDGVAGSTVAKGAEAALVDYSIYELAQNADGAVSSAMNGQASFSFFGKGLTATQHLAIVTRMKYFYSHVGATF